MARRMDGDVPAAPVLAAGVSDPVARGGLWLARRAWPGGLGADRGSAKFFV